MRRISRRCSWTVPCGTPSGRHLITGNGIGIDLLASAEQNTFTANVFRDNRTSVRKVLGSGENAWTSDGRGNDWGDPVVFDLDRDGVGDRPYAAGDPFLMLAASRPALEVYGGTLAAKALSWAEEAFPVFGVPRGWLIPLPWCPHRSRQELATRWIRMHEAFGRLLPAPRCSPSSGLDLEVALGRRARCLDG